MPLSLVVASTSFSLPLSPETSRIDSKAVSIPPKASIRTYFQSLAASPDTPLGILMHLLQIQVGSTGVDFCNEIVISMLDSADHYLLLIFRPRTRQAAQIGFLTLFDRRPIHFYLLEGIQ
jgi:hypothetical protein